jgi:transposase
MNDYSKQYCERAFGVRRWVWNWALHEMLRAKGMTNRMPTGFQLDAKYRDDIKAKESAGFAWIADQLVSGKLMSECLKDLERSFKTCKADQKDVNNDHHYRGKKWHKVQPHYIPRKKDSKHSFSYVCDSDKKNFRITGEHTFSFCTTSKKKDGRAVARTRESLAFLQNPNIKLCTMTIQREADKYWVCITYEKPNRSVTKPRRGTKVGIDLGVVISACCFDGCNIINAQFDTEHSMKLERLAKAQNEKLSRMKHGSSRYVKELRLQQERFAKAARIRKYNLECFTTMLLRNYKDIVVDDFSFKSALNAANHDKTYHCMVYMFKERLEAKALEYDSNIKYVKHQKKQKTTHKCAVCGSEAVTCHKDRTITCRNCGNVDGRDENAAKSTYKYY